MEFELGEEFLFYNILYFLFAFFLIFPPNEVIQLGFSIPSLFESYLGSERMHFIHYHMIRISLTLFIHSLIPIGYYAFIGFFLSDLELFKFSGLNIGWKIYIGFSILFPIGIGTIINYWSLNDYENHPISIKLRALSSSPNLPNAWKSIANEINVEFRRIDKFASGSLFNRIYLTENWILKVNLYTLNLCNNSNSDLTLTHATDLNLTQDGSSNGVQFLNILVKPLNIQNFKKFYIHLNALEYKEFSEKLQAPIREAADIIIKQSLPDQFLDAFRQQVFLNPTYRFNRNEIDTCVGCMRKEANVKLVRTCSDLDSGECKRCFCKPMWCLECLGKWFAYRQDQSQPNTWMSCKSTCATCRATFCVLDVCPVELTDD